MLSSFSGCSHIFVLSESGFIWRTFEDGANMSFLTQMGEVSIYRFTVLIILFLFIKGKDLIFLLFKSTTI